MTNIRLIQGDCLKEMPKLVDDGVKVDLVLTDPPYGTTACKWDAVIPFDEMWSCINNLTYDRTPIVLFSGQPFTSSLVMSNIKQFKYEWIYQKKSGTNFVLLKYAPAKVHENILVFCKKSPNYHPIKEKKADSGIQRMKYDYNPRNTKTEYSNVKRPYVKADVNNILKYPIDVRVINNLKPQDRGLHPTQKPVELLEYLIKTYTNKGDTVLDFTMGSGSTGVACANLNRKFIGIELDLDYYKIAEERIKEANVQQKLI